MAWAITGSSNFILMSGLYGGLGGGELADGLTFNQPGKQTVTILDILFPLMSTSFYMIYVKKVTHYIGDRVTVLQTDPSSVEMTNLPSNKPDLAS